MRLSLSPPGRPLWLITLADLSLLLVGFFVFLQATAHKPERDREAINAGIRQAFGGEPGTRLAVEANLVPFAQGSALLPGDLAAIRSWVRGALADPRTRLIVTGYSDGSTADRLSNSSLALAAARADAVASKLDISAERIRVGAGVLPGARRVTLTISYDP